MNENETYQTSDFLEIAYLITNDSRILGARREGNSDRVLFTFANWVSCEKQINSLLLGDDNVSASRFLGAIKKARKIIHSVP